MDNVQIFTNKCEFIENSDVSKILYKSICRRIDLEYPKDLHKLHNDFHFALEEIFVIDNAYRLFLSYCKMQVLLFGNLDPKLC